MSNRIRDLIEEFASKLETELKLELRDALERIGLGMNASSARSRRRTSAPRTTPSRNGAKRDPGALSALSERFAGFVAKHPGLRIEQINKQLGTSTKELALPIRKLVAEGRVRATGQRRSTTYSVGVVTKRASKRRRK